MKNGVMNNNKKIVICGNHSGGKIVINALLEAGYKIDYFVCMTPEQGIQYNISGYYDYSELARQFHIPVYYPEKYTLNSEKDREFFADSKFDLLIQGGWQRLFPEHVISSLSIGAIGIHGSADFLPKGRGRSPMNWSLIEDKKRFIMQLFLIKPGVDDGDVFEHEIFDITPFDDIQTLYFKYGIVYKQMLLRSLTELLKGEVTVYPQRGVPTYYAKRTPENAVIDWESMDIRQIYNAVRAQTHPYPGVIASIDGQSIRIWKCRIFDTRITYRNAAYGKQVEQFEHRLLINCLGGLLLIDDYEII